MKEERFQVLLKHRLDRIQQLLNSKGIEYSTNDNKLHNFDRAAIRSDQIREKALLGMLLKHEISLLDIVDDLQSNKLPSLDKLDEKISDTINYYILLEACITDRIEKEENDKSTTISS